MSHLDFLKRFPVGTPSSVIVAAATATEELLDRAGEALGEAAVHPRIHENRMTQRSS